MKASTRRLLGAGILVLLGAPACAGGAPPASPAPAGPADGVSAAEFEAIFRARTDSARNRFVAADVRFMTHMITHHAQALVMAALAPERAATSAVRVLAARIANAQQDEIETMQRWLRDRGQPVPELHGEGLSLMVHGAGQGEHDAHLMPGMLSAAELAALERARGPAFDRLFLQSMIRHHRGAVTMVEELFATDGAVQDEDVFRFASDVQVDQRTEIDRMERMLAADQAGSSAPDRL